MKKSYRDRLSLEIELLALHAMAGLSAVPRIVAVDLKRRILHQSFIRGRNLGVLMARQGVTDHVQDQVSVGYWGDDRWGPGSRAGVRAAALAALSASVDPGVVAKLGRLIEEIHQRGVTITDVKYGNVLLVDGDPHFCDFDRATVWRRNSWRCARVREHDREMFNYFFGGELLTEREFRMAVESFPRGREDLFSPLISYGHGYQSPGAGSLELGSGRWRCLRSALPAVVGKSILDLGSGNGVVALEMLRAGARRVAACEPDPVLARYARLNHRWFEFTDNRWYPGFQLLDGSLDEAAARDWSGYDIATVLGDLSGADPEAMASLVRIFRRDIACVVVQSGLPAERCSPAFLQQLLRTNGYPEQRVVAVAGDARPLVIGGRGGT